MRERAPYQGFDTDNPGTRGSAWLAHVASSLKSLRIRCRYGPNTEAASIERGKPKVRDTQSNAFARTQQV